MPGGVWYRFCVLTERALRGAPCADLIASAPTCSGQCGRFYEFKIIRNILAEGGSNMQTGSGPSTVSRAQLASGSTRRSVLLTAAAAASSALMQSEVARAAIVQTDTAKLPPLPLPQGIRSRYVPNINGLTFHVLEAGFESKGRPCLVLLHGYPEIAYGWRKLMLPLAAAGFHVIAPDMRGYGRTTGWDDSYDADIFPFRHANLVRDVIGLVFAFGYRTAAVVGRDAGSPVAAYCAVIRPDVFRSVAMMTSPFAGPPALPFDTVNGATQVGEPSEARSINDELAKLSRPRKHYQVYYTTREANEHMWRSRQGVH